MYRRGTAAAPRPEADDLVELLIQRRRGLRVLALLATMAARSRAREGAFEAFQEVALKEVILTAQGYEKLRLEIDHLQTEKRREVAERIRVAREFGDITENAEYDDAKNEQAMLEHRIAQLEERLLSARVITKKEISKDSVSVGSTVRLRDIAANKTVEYHIVGSAEANPSENKLSNESPVGRAIMGMKKGDTVEVVAPRGALKFKILEIKAA
jgi:transcription elongation factor GreA